MASNQELRQLSRKAEQLTVLQQHYESIAPSALKHNSHILQQRDKEVVIAADNGAVASKLRQMTSELISLFQARGCEVAGIQIKVQVAVHEPPSRPQPRRLSKAAHQALGQLDQDLADSPLKTALERLMKR
jgi:hypothetical protein